MKVVVLILGVIIIGLSVIIFSTPAGGPNSMKTSESASSEEVSATASLPARSVFTDGQYIVQVEESSLAWAGKKPLIEGYINSGSLGIGSGAIAVESGVATGSFTILMNTLLVADTPTKPGKESLLEGHLKGENWFDVEKFPEASFTLIEVVPRPDTDKTFLYDVRGNLKMKGVTNELNFPATIYAGNDGLLHASADFEFDRTKWGITAGSGSFFANLADNVIDDMVALSFNLIAKKQ